ncbi:apolipoprotein N-acyltransferase 1 [Spirochaetia bacterium]|nr:apolipoprotein N-acyltransferase 1 [Spirochaetia bacterium]
MNSSIKQTAKQAVGNFFVCLIAMLSSVLLFAASFPNPLFSNGLPFLAWVAYAPVFWLLYRVNIGASVFWGALYGYTSYGLFNYWLTLFHPMAGLIVNGIYLAFFAVLFPFLKLAVLLFPKRGYILQWLFWMVFEYLRTLGFVGYPYGITGYSQWAVLPLIQIAAVFGVWGVSALVVFPSAFMASLFKGELPRLAPPIKEFFRRERWSLILWAVAVAAALVYGFVSPLNYGGKPTVSVALIQHNTDPWRGDIFSYRQNFRVLKRLSDEALAAEKKPDLVVWSETAFVPRIYWHQTYRDDQESWVLVKELLDYLAQQPVPFVIGNDDGRKEYNKEGRLEEVDYNAVILFEKSEMAQIYRKQRLVPFTEHFPYQKQLPWFYDALVKADTHFWKKGTESTVFESRGVKFSSPICFEDTFGYLSRDFVRNGAELIVNLSNDAWSHSLTAQMQHFSMAVFRAVENRRALVRSTASGQTCAIDPNGKVLAMAEPFTEAWLTAEVPLLDGISIYTRHGDYLPRVFIILAIMMLITGVVLCILKYQKIRKNS